MARPRISQAEANQREKFGKLLRKWRIEELHLGLREAARIADLDHTTLSKIESGERPCALKYLPGLEEAYKVPLEILHLARSLQIPSALIRHRLEFFKTGEGRTETLPLKVTPEEKKDLTLFLGYLRFARG